MRKINNFQQPKQKEKLPQDCWCSWQQKETSHSTEQEFMFLESPNWNYVAALHYLKNKCCSSSQPVNAVWSKSMRSFHWTCIWRHPSDATWTSLFYFTAPRPDSHDFCPPLMNTSSPATSAAWPQSRRAKGHRPDAGCRSHPLRIRLGMGQGTQQSQDYFTPPSHLCGLFHWLIRF